MLARLDLALTNFSHVAQNHDLLWDLKRADRVSGLFPDIADKGRRALPQRALERFTSHVIPILKELRVQVVHNDFNPHNILLDPENCDEISGIIDFGDMVQAPLVQDLATAAAYQIMPEGYALEGVAEMAAAFHTILPLSSLEVEILPDLIATRMALTIAISSWRAKRHPANADYIMRNQASTWIGLERLQAIPPDEARAYLHARLGMR
jgi:Ser/Thr protein kinase RdoA (MazF antagonist)